MQWQAQAQSNRRSSLSKWALRAVPKIVLALLFFSNEVALAGRAGGAVVHPAPPAAETEAINSQAVETDYRMCIARSKQNLTAQEIAEIANFRKQIATALDPYRNVPSSSNSEKAFQEALVQAAQKYSPEMISARLGSRYQLSIVSEKLARIAATSVGLNQRNYRNYMYQAANALYRQKALDLVAFDRLHQQLAADIATSYMNQNDQALGVTVPLSLTMPPDNQLAAAIAILNTVSQLVTSVQLENESLRQDRRQFYFALAKNAAYGVAGFGALVGTLYFGPLFLAKGTAIAGKIGVSALSGQIGAGIAVGDIGGPGAELFYQSISTTISPYFRSLENGTPYSCEVRKASALANTRENVVEGLYGGTLFGSLGTVAGHLVPKTSIISAALAVGIGIAYEGGTVMYEAYKAHEYYVLAQQLTALKNIPEDLKSDQAALENIAWRECYDRLDQMSEHFGKALVIGTLVKAFFWDKEFVEALHEGRQKIKGMLAYSSDTIPSVATSAVELAKNGATSVSQMVRGPSVRPRVLTFPEQVREFIAKANTASAAVQVPLAATQIDRSEWLVDVKAP